MRWLALQDTLTRQGVACAISTPDAFCPSQPRRAGLMTKTIHEDGSSRRVALQDNLARLTMTAHLLWNLDPASHGCVLAARAPPVRVADTHRRELLRILLCAFLPSRARLQCAPMCAAYMES